MANVTIDKDNEFFIPPSIIKSFNCPNCGEKLEGQTLKEYEGGWYHWHGWCNSCTVTDCGFMLRKEKSK